MIVMVISGCAAVEQQGTLTMPVDVQTEFYFANQGNDGNPGTKDAPWKSLQKLQGLQLKPGDIVYFARGSSFHGGVIIDDNGTCKAPITITAYGEGHMPKFTNTDIKHLNGNIFQVQGNHIIIDGLYFHNGPPAPRANSRVVRQMGAVFIARDAKHNIIRNCEVYDMPIGFQSYGEHCLITRNYIHDCTGFLSYPGWGPVGIMVATSNHEISYNRIENYIVTGGTWGSDGGAIEIDEEDIPKENIEIHHNISIGNEGFLEIITSDTRNVHVHHNISDDWQQFIFFWGGKGCLVEHNTVLCRRPQNSNIHVVFTFPKGVAKNNHIRNNIFCVTRGLQVFAGESPYYPMDYDQPHDHNLFFSLDGSVDDPIGTEPGEGDIIANPRFVNLDKLDLRLRAGSPAIDAAADAGLAIDFEGNPRSTNKAPDIGAYEFRSKTPAKNGASESSR
jgi:hypothetical protein